MIVPLAPTLPADVREVLSDLTDQDDAFAGALRSMLWDVYLEAGRPLGPDEDAMIAWWAYGQGTTVQ